ncbi:Abhydrolase domain-containing protein mpaH [Hypsizygus marmoreus]|uniref:Abhydrolase domain-containing protein mpaH n=1 Tax=Hypsizygus marmoreus TaxID=39966 RepID=A0A369JXC8_HYPMA|nr:Abhydrolase domain-containing protein mpaH [Hypsizygus marmoreus]
METKSFIIPYSEDPGSRPLKVAAKRYRFPDRKSDNGPGVILLLVHGVGFNKETWEPFLEELGALQHASDACRTHIKEAWAFDCPNHGEAAVLNDKALFNSPTHLLDISLEEYARTGLRILTSGIIESSDKDRIIVVGHSVGSIAALWLTSMYQQEHKKLIDMLIMVEPPGEVFGKLPIMRQKSEAFIEVTKTRRDIWASKEEAFKWFAARRPWKVWDQRALKAYVDYGLCPLPTSGYPDRTEGVTLSCHKMHELFAYTDLPELNIVAPKLPSVRQDVPIHVIVSGKSFLRPKDAVLEQVASTPGMSTSKLPDADHLVVQETPKLIAQEIYKVIEEAKFRRATKRSRL